MPQKPIMGIYSVTHNPSGRVYVGASSNIPQRWQYHRAAMHGTRHENGPMQTAFMADGPDAFEFAIIEVVTNRDTLLEREQYWMDSLSVTVPEHGFNLHPTAGSAKGHRLTPEQRASVAAANRGRTHTSATREKMSISAMGNQRSKGTHKGTLSSEIIPAILRRAAYGESVSTIANDCNVTTGTINRVIKRRIWLNVQIPEDVAHLFPLDPEARRARGSRGGRAKLNESDIIVIRERLARGETTSAIAADYNVTDPLISAIRLRRLWKHVL